MDDESQNAPAAPQPPQTGWDLACEGILRTEFGRRPSQALNRAIAQLQTEELAGPATANLSTRWRNALLRFWAGSAGGWRAGGATVAVLIVAATLWLLHSRNVSRDENSTEYARVCRLTDASGAHWAPGSQQPQPGESLAAGPLQLDSGVINLEFAGGAEIAVEGPATLQLSNSRQVELRSGKLAAMVPKPAHGFAVVTPTARIVDLGTRFGVTASGESASRVDVFEGRVRAMRNDRNSTARRHWNLTQNRAMRFSVQGGVSVAALPQSAYPQPEFTMIFRPANCGFDVLGSAGIGGVPTVFGYWSGPAYQLIGNSQGIAPAEGAGMLQFLARRSRPADGKLAPGDSSVWQLMQLSDLKSFLSGGHLQLTAVAHFNRTRGTAESSKQFSLTVAAFRGSPSDAATLWARRDTAAVALVERSLESDDNPGTWQDVQATMDLPPEADFLMIQIRAVWPENTRGGTDPFPGNFADLVDLSVRVPMRGSQLSATP